MINIYYSKGTRIIIEENEMYGCNTFEFEFLSFRI
jgi:hypothetical protein